MWDPTFGTFRHLGGRWPARHVKKGGPEGDPDIGAEKVNFWARPEGKNDAPACTGDKFPLFPQRPFWDTFWINFGTILGTGIPTILFFGAPVPFYVVF